jgi:hypothetical protein
MNIKHQKSIMQSNRKVTKDQSPLPQQEVPDDRFPGTFFRVPGVPMPGKTTWSLVK